mmetsp:Transcript_29780/g.79166  ORF Transcript_29780/g.79166 Transcript_29780/m.79166 type:complete len:207 (-) Transcript_29780:288-908(-)
MLRAERSFHEGRQDCLGHSEEMNVSPNHVRPNAASRGKTKETRELFRQLIAVEFEPVHGESVHLRQQSAPAFPILRGVEVWMQSTFARLQQPIRSTITDSARRDAVCAGQYPCTVSTPSRKRLATRHQRDFGRKDLRFDPLRRSAQRKGVQETFLNLFHCNSRRIERGPLGLQSRDNNVREFFLLGGGVDGVVPIRDAVRSLPNVN